MAVITDPIADMLTRIRNALIAKHNAYASIQEGQFTQTTR